MRHQRLCKSNSHTRQRALLSGLRGFQWYGYVSFFVKYLISMANQRINSGSYIYRLYNLMSRGNRGFLLNDRVTSALSIGQTKTSGTFRLVRCGNIYGSEGRAEVWRLIFICRNRVPGTTPLWLFWYGVYFRLVPYYLASKHMGLIKAGRPEGRAVRLGFNLHCNGKVLWLRSMEWNSFLFLSTCVLSISFNSWCVQSFVFCLLSLLELWPQLNWNIGCLVWQLRVHVCLRFPSRLNPFFAEQSLSKTHVSRWLSGNSRETRNPLFGTCLALHWKRFDRSSVNQVHPCLRRQSGSLSPPAEDPDVVTLDYIWPST